VGNPTARQKDVDLTFAKELHVHVHAEFRRLSSHNLARSMELA
jgi:hypothetical protein